MKTSTFSKVLRYFLCVIGDKYHLLLIFSELYIRTILYMKSFVLLALWVLGVISWYNPLQFLVASIEPNESCDDAIRLHCGDEETGSNLNTTPLTEVLNDCIAEDTTTYLGVLWFSWIGTGDSLHVIASAVKSAGSSNFIDLHVYENSGSDCDAICIGGVYDVDENPPVTVPLRTQPGKTYYMMIGTFHNGNPTANIESYSISLICVCGDSDLSFMPMYSFENGDSYSFRTDQTIYAENTIVTGTNIAYDGGISITLGPGFDVEQGAVFAASPEGCLVPARLPISGDEGSAWHTSEDGKENKRRR